MKASPASVSFSVLSIILLCGCSSSSLKVPEATKEDLSSLAS